MSLPNFHRSELVSRLGQTAGDWMIDRVCTQLDVTAGTVSASKAIVVDANSDHTGGRNITASGTIQGATVTVTTALILPFAAAAASGAITLKSGIVYLTKSGVAAMTLADPTATTDDGKVLIVMAATANAHTLSNAAGSGFNAGGAGTDVGTFGGAIGDNIALTAYQGKWYVISSVNVTLG